MKRPAMHHWTCEHSAPDIRRAGAVRPNLGISWWTDIDMPSRQGRAAVGLTATIITCDRMAYRCSTHEMDLLVPWWEYKVTQALSEEFVASLEANPALRPDRWWVAQVPVPVFSVRKAGLL